MARQGASRSGGPSSASGERRRRRRTPEVARAEILDSAEAMLRERPFRDLTVEEVMAPTGMAKSSFWVYFRDRHDLVAQVVARLGLALGDMTDRWLLGNGEAEADARAAIEGVVGVFVEHGPVLRAIADAGASDERLDGLYRGLVARFVDATAAHIRREQRAGRIRQCDARETARALILMNERYLSEVFGRGPAPSRARAAEVLFWIWWRALYVTDGLAIG